MILSKPLPASDAPRVRLFLKQVCTAPERHARFLNTLSLLEHIGSRKIMASQSRAGADLALSRHALRHLAEETRHAYFFRRAAEAIAQRELSYQANEILAGSHARLYMGRLDAFIARSASGQAAYLYMSLIVELRAVWFYKIYQEVLKETGQPLSLTSLLAEETRHLEEMDEHLYGLGENLDARLPVFSAFEETHFIAMLAGLEHSVCAPPAELEARVMRAHIPF
jgi:hypothetical protein